MDEIQSKPGLKQIKMTPLVIRDESLNVPKSKDEYI